MTSQASTLSIDFGEVGYWNSKHPFRIRFDIGPLTELIRDAENAYRVYELLLLDRPGDVWDYVWVVIEAVPPSVADSVARARQEVGLKHEDDAERWPDDRVPFSIFDGFFSWTGDDTAPEDAAWLENRDSTLMRSLSELVLSIARAAQSRLQGNDHLLCHLASRAKSRGHAYCYLERGVARTKERDLIPNEAQHPPAFYNKLKRVLCDANLASVAYRAGGDYRVLRMMATEQRRRATLTGHDAENALHLSALVNHKISNEAWDSKIWFFEEGLAHGDLFIEGGGLGGGNLKEVFESNYRAPARFIFASQDEGSIRGYAAEAGDGWMLYTNQSPDTRRLGLQRIDERRRSKIGAVLSFAEDGATLFDYEKSVVVVGTEVSAAARGALAIALVEWQRSGGTPLLVVIGDTAPFDRAGFEGVITVPADANDNNSMAEWFMSELRRARPWIDAVLALHVPRWVSQVLTGRLKRRDEPWPSWVVATTGEPSLKVDHWLEGDMARLLLEAHRRAEGMRRSVGGPR